MSLPPGAKGLVSMASVIASAGFVFADTTTTDDFSKASPAWTAERAGAEGRFSVVNGRLEYLTSDSPSSNDSATRRWIGGVGGYARDWSVQVDVSLSEFTIPANGSAGIALYVRNAARGSEDFIRLQLRRGGPTSRYFQSDGFARRKSLGAQTFNTTSTSGSLRVTYTASTHTLSALYDADGAANGESFAPFVSVDVASEKCNWEMKGDDQFEVELVGHTNYCAIASGDISADNFAFTGPNAASVAKGADAGSKSTPGMVANLPKKANPVTPVLPSRSPVAPAMPAMPSTPVTPPQAPAGNASTAPELPMPVPNLSAKTGTASNRLVRTNQTTERTTQSLKSTSVDVNLSFFTPPPSPYEVQCFFIAKGDVSGQRFVFDAVVQRSQNRELITTFTSQPLDGGSKTFTAIPFIGSYTSRSGGGTFTGVATSSSQTLGNKIEGWVVRVVSRGRVLRTESNQPALKEVAAAMAPELDKAAASIEN